VCCGTALPLAGIKDYRVIFSGHQIIVDQLPWRNIYIFFNVSYNRKVKKVNYITVALLSSCRSKGRE
jgi:hypothetical protein